MIRAIVFFGMWLAIVSMPLPTHAGPAEQGTPSLSLSRGDVTVTDGVVRLGDLFTNTGTSAGQPVDQAPVPGAQAAYDVYRLEAIARAHGLAWQARSWSEKVVVRRAGQTIGDGQIRMVLRDALQERLNFGAKWDIELANRDLTITLPLEKPATLAVERLRHNPATGQFVAVIAAPAGDPEAKRLNVAGRLHRLVEVPTLVRRMSNGDIIGKNDITWVTMRSDRVNRNVITNAEGLIGATPARTLMAGKPLLSGEIRAPRIVTKGALVTLMLRTPHMILTSKGRALQHGAKGDVIRVMNSQSKTIIEGEVSAAGTVVVTAAPLMPAAQAARR